MLVISQPNVSQLYNDALSTTEQNACIYYNFQTFWEPRCVSMRYDKCQNLGLKLHIQPHQELLCIFLNRENIWLDQVGNAAVLFLVPG
jgi:hypothetical protein